MAKYDNDKTNHSTTEKSRAKFRTLDAGDAVNGASYTAQTWLNNANEGEVGPYTLAWLNRLEAALANGSAHYTHVALVNNKDCGLDPGLIVKLNTISAHVATIRP